MKSQLMYIVVALLIVAVVIVAGVRYYGKQNTQKGQENAARPAAVSQVNLAVAVSESKGCQMVRELQDKGEFDKAVELGNKLLIDNPDDVSILRVMGDIYSLQNHFMEAERMFLKSISLNSSDEYVLRKLGDMYLSQKNNEKALEYYQRTVNLGNVPNAVWAYAGLSNIYSMMNDKKKADQMFNKAMELAGDENTRNEIKKRIGASSNK